MEEGELGPGAAAVPLAAARATTPAAPPAADGRATVEVVDLVDSDSDKDGAGRPQGGGNGGARQPRRQAPTPPRRRAQNVIDLTTGTGPAADVQIVRSTVQRVPMRGAKRARPTAAQQLSPAKQRLLEQLRNPPQPQLAEPEPEGPKCGICMEPMGGNHTRQMASGSCGHVYCRECLIAAVKASKKCPSCRRSMQPKGIHPVFIQMA